ncbi:CoA-binding domain-containing protein [Enterococcus haemoperoxidus ATCC BAA-382]|uniref:CoA-binding domain-containing protein n=1 Tax=Enterococcus haemoperoxidus ATCC BAA-382 TaxID=1158608 RepID=R2QPX5_9ENTE|nr:CoA-binding protein [Enterococcus haemoperoxidus]EOH98557.1 CoA-binding domain-containing protein [Enterococcus haemoperoxidus ATCC BAA-382]EOT62260.1 CoA-binding domain-containing protein [Enterococcus haemoperoxidus ATCC BAA-382]OJG55658.1 CoA-binding domain-containing protein [Enterococcus haemoperoxidus]
MPIENPSQEQIFDYLKQAKRIAVVGLSAKEDRTSYKIAKLLQEYGYEIIPVNPILAGQEILGEKVYEKLQDIPGQIDIVDIFRRSEFLPEVAQDFIETKAKVFWAQLGLESEEAAEMLKKAGRNAIIMNRCIKIELAEMPK